MDSFFQRYRNIVVLAAVLLAQLLGIAVQLKRQDSDGHPSVLQYWVMSAVAPVEKGFVQMRQGIGWMWSGYIWLHGAREENERLKQQIGQMRIEQDRLYEDAAQGRRLQALLSFKEQQITKTVVAQVMGAGGAEASRIFYIDRGTNDGVRADMAVITPAGVVGKILRAADSWSQVLRIDDQSSGVGAILVKSRAQGVVKGSAGGDVVLRNIMGDEKLTAGDWVVTSGGDRVYPKGLPVGQVSSLKLETNGFYSIKLKPAVDLNRLEEVLVVTEAPMVAPESDTTTPQRAADILSQRLPGLPQNKPAADDKNKPAADKNKAAAPAPAPATPQKGTRQ